VSFAFAAFASTSIHIMSTISFNLSVIATLHQCQSKSIYTSVRQSHAFHNFTVKSAIIFSFGFAMMCGCPIIVVDATFALLVPFGAVLLHVMINGRLFVVIITHPPACRLAAVISHSPLRLAGLTHLKLLSSSSLQSKARV